MTLRLIIVFAAVWSFALPAFAEEPPAFVEVEASDTEVYAGQAFTLTLRVGVDLAFFREHGVSLFRQAMDIPLQVSAPWTLALPGAEPRGSSERPGAEPSRFVLNDAVRGFTGVDAERGGRAFRIFELEQHFVAGAAGQIEVAAPGLRYAHATRFEDNFAGGRVALDRKDVMRSGEALRIRVLPLPAEGRPDGFDGAVGRFAISASAVPARLDVGDTLTLTVVVEAQPAFAHTPLPRFEFEGFHRLGVQEAPGRATIELVPTRAVRQVPAIRYVYFDPELVAYRTVETSPLPIVVDGAPPTEAENDAVESARGPLGWMWMLFGLFGLVAVGVALRRRRAAEVPTDAAAERVRAASVGLREAADTGAGQAEALAEYLAAHLGCPPAAVVGDGLAPRLERLGVSADTSRQAASALERLLAAGYGSGASVSLDADLVAALEIALNTPER